jgi:hypothetical protein
MYYILKNQQANKIGVTLMDNGVYFNPFVMLQKNGNYLVPKQFVEDNKNVLHVNFSGYELTNVVNNFEPEIPNALLNILNN